MDEVRQQILAKLRLVQRPAHPSDPSARYERKMVELSEFTTSLKATVTADQAEDDSLVERLATSVERRAVVNYLVAYADSAITQDECQWLCRAIDVIEKGEHR